MLLALVPDPLWWSVGDPHPDSGETSLELSFRAGAPTDGAPFGVGQHILGRYRYNVRNVPLTGTTALCNWPDHPHIGRVHLEVPRNTDRPSKFASCEPLTERRAQPITGIRQHAAKAHTGRDGTIDLRQSHFRFRSCRSTFGRNTRSLQSRPLARPTLGKKQPQRQYDGHLTRASVSDTRVWQFAVLPSADVYCGATPTECVPFLGIAVSSITSTASLPPTSLSAWTSSLVSTGPPTSSSCGNL